MTRNWGLPARPGRTEFRDARSARPLATLGVTALYGIIGAAAAAISFAEARDILDNLFHGRKLIMAVLAAGFGCWLYIVAARPRFAAHFTGAGDAFSVLVRFYAAGALALFFLYGFARLAGVFASDLVGVLLLCGCGGAGAAAAFQTVLAFVPGESAGERG